MGWLKEMLNPDVVNKKERVKVGKAIDRTKSNRILMIFIGICLFGSLVALFGSSFLGGEYVALETGTAIAQVGAFVGVIWYFTARMRENKESKTV